jgi:bacillithiol system protein YtxJ
MGILDRFLGRTRVGAESDDKDQAGLVTLSACTRVEDLLRERFLMIFKHSTACPVSWAAHAQVTRFLRDNPGAPVKMVRVIQERALSQGIAAATGVRHESPQLIALREGEVVARASHGQITAEKLKSVLDSSVASVTSTNPVTSGDSAS